MYTDSKEILALEEREKIIALIEPKLKKVKIKKRKKNQLQFLTN